MSRIRRRGRAVTLSFQGKEYTLREGETLRLNIEIDENRKLGQSTDGVTSYVLRARVSSNLHVAKIR